MKVSKKAPKNYLTGWTYNSLSNKAEKIVYYATHVPLDDGSPSLNEYFYRKGTTTIIREKMFASKSDCLRQILGSKISLLSRSMDLLSKDLEKIQEIFAQLEDGKLIPRLN